MFALLRLRARRVDRPIGKRFTFLQPRCDFDSVNGAGLLILLPGGPGDVTPHDGLNGEDLEFANLHTTIVQRRPQRFRNLRWKVEGEEMRAERCDGILEDLEPRSCAEGEEFAFVGNALRKYFYNVSG